MIIEPLSDSKGPVRRLDPRTRVAVAAVFSTATALSQRLETGGSVLLAALVLAGISGINWKEAAKRLFAANGFIFFLFVVLPVTIPGTSVARFGPFVITQEGLMLSVRIAVKANAILLILLPFVATLMPSALGRALHWFKLPDKLVFLLMMTYRYLFVTAAELGRLHRAAKIRGFVSKTDVHTYRTWAHLLGMLFVRARERARRIHWAMLCRGFTGRFHVLRRLAFTRNDAYAAGISAIGLIYMAMTEWMTF